MSTPRRSARDAPSTRLTTSGVDPVIRASTFGFSTPTARHLARSSIFRRTLGCVHLLGCSVPQLSLDKGPYVPVEDRLNVTFFHRCAVIFYHLVWVEHIGADLGPKADVLLIPLEGPNLGVPLLSGPGKEPRFQDPHCHGPVLH